ncbi:DUF3800 domain-containing protein [Leptospira noguchii]|uniref:DUF3800 domain-containing protein n=1 Tax=Leptospira noguchii TaxID=28182 RepID=UPI0003284CF0|nr:DUF3800 domain-containing protein [Leptospira noguchii]EMS82213.1 PF12686 family protein [Leptospira noguchii str. Cascata]
MKRRTLEEIALSWAPEDGDRYGEDKKKFIEYLIHNCKGFKNGQSIKVIIKNGNFKYEYNKEAFQHQIIVPFRESDKIFIGTSQKGIYFIESSADAKNTLDFYTNRIRSEQKHLRNLKKIIRKNNLFKQLEHTKKEKTTVNVYFDESGTPSLKNIENDPFFIVTAVVIESKRNKPIYELDKRFRFIRDLLGKQVDFEFKSTKLKLAEYKKVLTELSTVDYEFASIIFVKTKLTGAGFKHSKSFYKFAFDKLLKELLEYLGGSINLYFDEYSGKNSEFQREFKDYITKKNTEYYFKKVEQLEMFQSSDHPFIQVADLIAGVLKNQMKNKNNLFELIEEKCIFTRVFPY